MSLNMSLKMIILTGALALTPVLATAQMLVEDAYARSSSPVAQTGAAFMAIVNQSDMDDRMVSATSDVAERVELHTHIDAGNGVMQMRRVEDGIPIAAGETHILARGGDHIMLLGLRRSLNQGEVVEITLSFEHADPVTIMVPVDLERQDHGGAMMDHGMMDHGTMDNDTDG